MTSSVSELIERVRRLFHPKPKLKWTVQHVNYPPQSGDGLLHCAVTAAGTFEIYEDLKGHFLLHFPKRMRLPAELFHDLGTAKTHALQSLKEK